MYGKTAGALNAAMGSVLSIWHAHRTASLANPTAPTLPTEEELSRAAAHTSFDALEIDAQTNTVYISDSEMTLDVGALAKGYAGDCAVEILREYGISSALLNLGGNVQAIGSKPDGSPWNIAVQNPAAPSSPLCSLAVTDAAVITSGNYERYFIAEDGTKYGHILDPATGAPVDNELASVTIVGTSGVRCDALSTALFVLGLEDAADFWRNSGDFEMLLVTQDDTLYYTQGLSEALTLPDGRTAEVITRD
jgi:thiamine biosynthesis lipoprotein